MFELSSFGVERAGDGGRELTIRSLCTVAVQHFLESGSSD